MPSSLPLVALAFVLVQESAPTATRPATRSAAGAAEQTLAALGATVEHFLAESTIQTPTGQPAGHAVVLTRRALVERESTILDQMTTLTGHLPPHDQLAIMKVDGQQVSIRERGNSFTGQGTLTGPAWAWTSIQYSLTLATGGTVDISVEYNPDGYVGKRAYRGPDGAPRLVFQDRGRRISKDCYDVLRTNLRSAAPGSPASRPAVQSRPLRARSRPAGPP